MANMTAATPQRKLSWSAANLLVLVYAFIPVIWIISLSLKSAGTLNDGKFLPRAIAWNSRKILTISKRECRSSTAWARCASCAAGCRRRA